MKPVSLPLRMLLTCNCIMVSTIEKTSCNYTLTGICIYHIGIPAGFALSAKEYSQNVHALLSEDNATLN